MDGPSFDEFFAACSSQGIASLSAESREKYRNIVRAVYDQSSVKRRLELMAEMKTRSTTQFSEKGRNKNNV